MACITRFIVCCVVTVCKYTTLDERDYNAALTRILELDNEIDVPHVANCSNVGTDSPLN